VVADVLREHAGASVIGRALCAMGLGCALAGILLEGVSVEIPGIALGAAGYGFATRSSDRAGQVLGVATVVLCAVLMALPSFDLPGLFLES
jgi:hypothetical protein